MYYGYSSVEADEKKSFDRTVTLAKLVLFGVLE